MDKKQDVKLADGAENLEKRDTPDQYASDQAKKLKPSSADPS